MEQCLEAVLAAQPSCQQFCVRGVVDVAHSGPLILSMSCGRRQACPSPFRMFLCSIKSARSFAPTCYNPGSRAQRRSNSPPLRRDRSHAQPAFGASMARTHNSTAMGADHLADDGQAQPAACGRAFAYYQILCSKFGNPTPSDEHWPSLGAASRSCCRLSYDNLRWATLSREV